MATLAEMRERINHVSAEMRTLATKDERSADDEARLDTLLAEFNDLGPKIVREQSIQDATRDNGHRSERVSGVVPAAGAEAAEKRAAEYQSLGQRFAESDQVKRVREQGAKKSDPMAVGSFYHADEPEIAHRAGMTPQEVRALVTSGGLPNSYIQPQFVGGVFRGDDLQGTVRDVLINGQTNSDAITFFRETSFTNNAAAVAEATATTGTSGLKQESALALEEATVAVKTIAHWIPITRQILWDAAQMQTYVEQRLLDGLRLAESDQLLNGDGTGANILGLTNQSGVQVLDAAAFTAAPVADAGDANENFNRILRGRVNIRAVGRARANFVVIHPADHETFLTATNANGDYYGAGPFSGNGVANIWGLRVVEDENMDEGTALVGDGRMAAVWDRMQAQILIDTINDQFVRNMLTILAEERLALTVFRPQAFALVELV